MRNRIVCVAILLLLALPAAGQTVTGTISGNVQDLTGGAMPGVKVNARNDQTGFTRESMTNEAGFYQLAFLPLGSYSVTVEAAGFQPVLKRAVGVELNKTTVSDFTLKPSAVTTAIEVTGEVPQIETTAGELKHGLDTKTIEETPLPGRNYISLVEQIPGFAPSPWTGPANNPTNSVGSYAAFNGTGSRASTFQIDGVNNDDSSENQNRQSVNISSIREFQVLTNSFSAEFGRAGGAVILVQTKSGTNRFHGDAYDFLQNDVFNANGFFQNQRATPRSIVRRHQYGWTVGGPILRDKLFFFHSGERIHNNTSSSISRFMWLPSDTPRACNAGETSKPGGPICVDPATHPNLQRDLAFMKDIMDLWKTPELQGVTPNDPESCQDLIVSGRPNRCVKISGLIGKYPRTDYSGRLDWNAPRNTNVALRYQYSRVNSDSPRIIFGDNYGIQNNRQYNMGLTASHVYSGRQTGEFRFGFGNRTTLQDVVDGNHIPIIRFGTAGAPSVVIGTSANVPINRRQHDTQLVYNHSLVQNLHTMRAGIDQRFMLLDDVASATHRGYWNFTTLDSLTAVRAGTGYTGWEMFLQGITRFYQKGYGPDYAENRFKETNLYFQDDWRVRPNLTLNLGVRWEGVGAPHENKDRFSYGYGGDWNNVVPRLGFAYTPHVNAPWLRWLTGEPGQFVIRGGYGINHGRVFQSIFSQSGLNFRAQPPNGYFGDFTLNCPNEISDPSCGFAFTPGTATRTVAAEGGGVKVKGGTLAATLLLPDPQFHMPYVQNWSLTLERQLPGKFALQIAYAGNRGIGNPYYDSTNDARFPIASPLVTVDVGGGNYQPVVFDRVCRDFTDPICLTLTGTAVNPNTSGSLKTFSALASTTATLAQKGIVIEGGVPHGYISLSTPRANERRPDPNFVRNQPLRNFGWSYYHGLTTKLNKRLSHGLSFTAFWTVSKAIDTGSEVTYTGVDSNTPTGKGNAARSLRGLSSYDIRHRVVFSYGYELPFFRTQQGLMGRVLGGWQVSGTTTFQSGNPFTVVAGYDVNLDGLGNDRPLITDAKYLYQSVDNGRAQTSCPSTVIAGTNCPDTLSQNQILGSWFIPAAAGTIAGDQRFIAAGSDGTGTIGRNTYFMHGLNNFDLAFGKKIRIREDMRLEFRMEWYNLLNRVTFEVPARTILSGTPLGRITAQRNPSNYVNSARDNGSRMGQLSLRFIF